MLCHNFVFLCVFLVMFLCLYVASLYCIVSLVILCFVCFLICYLVFRPPGFNKLELPWFDYTVVNKVPYKRFSVEISLRIKCIELTAVVRAASCMLARLLLRWLHILRTQSGASFTDDARYIFPSPPPHSGSRPAHHPLRPPPEDKLPRLTMDSDTRRDATRTSPCRFPCISPPPSVSEVELCDSNRL